MASQKDFSHGRIGKTWHCWPHLKKKAPKITIRAIIPCEIQSKPQGRLPTIHRSRRDYKSSIYLKQPDTWKGGPRWLVATPSFRPRSMDSLMLEHIHELCQILGRKLQRIRSSTARHAHFVFRCRYPTPTRTIRTLHSSQAGEMQAFLSSCSSTIGGRKNSASSIPD